MWFITVVAGAEGEYANKPKSAFDEVRKVLPLCHNFSCLLWNICFIEEKAHDTFPNTEITNAQQSSKAKMVTRNAQSYVSNLSPLTSHFQLKKWYSNSDNLSKFEILDMFALPRNINYWPLRIFQFTKQTRKCFSNIFE